METTKKITIVLLVTLISIISITTVLAATTDTTQTTLNGDPNYDKFTSEMNFWDRIRLNLFTRGFTAQTIVNGFECSINPDQSGEIRVDSPGELTYTANPDIIDLNGDGQTGGVAYQLFRIKEDGSGWSYLGEKKADQGETLRFPIQQAGNYHYDVYFCDGAATCTLDGEESRFESVGCGPEFGCQEGQMLRERSCDQDGVLERTCVDWVDESLPGCSPDQEETTQQDDSQTTDTNDDSTTTTQITCQVDKTQPTSNQQCVDGDIYQWFACSNKDDVKQIKIQECGELQCDPAQNICIKDQNFKITNIEGKPVVDGEGNRNNETISYKISVQNVAKPAPSGFTTVPTQIRYEVMLLTPQNYRDNNFFSQARQIQSGLGVNLFTAEESCGGEPFVTGGSLNILPGQEVTAPFTAQGAKWGDLKVPDRGEIINGGRLKGRENYNPQGEYFIVAYLFDKCTSEGGNSFGPISKKINILEDEPLTIPEQSQVGGKKTALLESQLKSATKTELREASCSTEQDCSGTSNCAPLDQLPTEVEERAKGSFIDLGITTPEGICVVEDHDGTPGEVFNTVIEDLSNSLGVSQGTATFILVGGIALLLLIILGSGGSGGRR